MERRKFRFKTELYYINDMHNVIGFVICSGHGYSFKTFCCKNCGEIFAVDLQFLQFKKTDIKKLVENKKCPNCNDSLKTSLVDYPENIFYNGTVLKNKNSIDKLNFRETELKEVYELT